MSIEQKVSAIEALFDKLEGEIAVFKDKSGLFCSAGCGKCCTKVDIEASPLEFLPWAFHIFLHGKAEDVLKELKERSNPICYNYKPLSVLENTKGSCGTYRYRALICRLFGFGASRDKFGQLRLATCKIIKEEQQENYQKNVKDINDGLEVPIFTDYYMNLSQIDFNLGNKIVPINKAMKIALEEVLQYYAYRPFPEGMNLKIS